MRTALLVALLMPLAALAMPVQTVVITDGITRLEVRAEVAETEGDRKRGLMFREQLCTACGMLFVWPKAGKRAFWMKNTPLPLDLLFIRQGVVTGIHPQATPYDETLIPSPGVADMVLEVNAGWAAAHGVATGWRLAPSVPVQSLHR